jgi:RNA polymerase sigma factor (sigma-70 family)
MEIKIDYELLEKKVKEYKKEKSDILFREIYNLIKPRIQSRAKYVYEQEWYPKNLFHECKFCKNCLKLQDVEKEVTKIICEDCEICKCVKGAFNLRNSHLCEYEDVEQDLWIEFTRIIEHYDCDREFKPYFDACTRYWRPSLLDADLVRGLYTQSLEFISEEDKEIDVVDENTEEKIERDIDLEKILFNCETKIEKRIVKLLYKDPTLTQEEIAKKLKKSQQYISLVLKKLQKKFKTLLVKS